MCFQTTTRLARFRWIGGHVSDGSHIFKPEKPVAAVVCQWAGILEHLLQRRDFRGDFILFLDRRVFGRLCRGCLRGILSAFAHCELAEVRVSPKTYRAAFDLIKETRHVYVGALVRAASV